MEQMTLSRKEREKIRHKEEILGAALNLFSTKGFHNVSMQDVAGESEFAVGTLYNFFQSKEQLFAELLKDCAEKIYKLLWPILESNQPEDEKIKAFIIAHGRFAEENIKFIKFYVSEYGNLTPVQRPPVKEADEIKSVLYKKLEDTIKSGIDKKIFRPVDSKILALAIISTIQYFIFESSENFIKAQVEEGLAKIENLFGTMLFAGESQ